ncbi:putative myosin-binding protein [Helianthus annuus]|nr:putative myosin-binding protein [Helianthus annuus]
MGLKNNNSSSLQSPNYFHRLSKALQFAVSEWLLMFLLFIDACFTYLIAKFASYCQLQGPCVLCSRYDHLLANDKTGIYWDSFCNHHKSEISSLVITSHVNGIICENCLVNNRFNDETFRLQNHDSSGSRICFCCNEQYGSRDHVKNLLPTNSLHSHASESLITNAEHAKNEKNIFVDESLESCVSIHSEKNLTARSSEVEYPKDDDVNSGNELELPVPDIVPDIIPEVHLKADSHFEFSDIHNDSATVATRDIDEVKCQNGEIKEAISPPVSFDEVSSLNNAKIPADDFLETINPPITNEAIKDPAALYTEALQSLRMMEEQAEYDNEALQKANDIIEEKDKQIRELEELLRKTSEDVTE